MGGTCLEDIEILRKDYGLKAFKNIKNIPSVDTVFRALQGEKVATWCRRLFHANALRIVGKSGIKEVGFDHDATYDDCNKPFAAYSYKKRRQMSLALGYIPECGIFIEADLRPGNISPKTGIVEQLKNATKQLRRRGIKLAYFRSDCAGYQSEIFHHCNKNNIRFYVSAEKIDSVIQMLKNMS